MEIKFVHDIDLAITVMKDAGKWLEETGKSPSKWWQLDNLNPEFLLQYANQDEFCVGLIDQKPAVAAVLQIDQNAQDWVSIDGDNPKPALYIHWLCVARKYAGLDFPRRMTHFAAIHAKENSASLLRADTNAEEMKLRKIYEDLGFKLAGIVDEGYRKTAFYQKLLS